MRSLETFLNCQAATEKPGTLKSSTALKTSCNIKLNNPQKHSNWNNHTLLESNFRALFKVHWLQLPGSNKREAGKLFEATPEKQAEMYSSLYTMPCIEFFVLSYGDKSPANSKRGARKDILNNRKWKQCCLLLFLLVHVAVSGLAHYLWAVTSRWRPWGSTATARSWRVAMMIWLFCKVRPQSIVLYWACIKINIVYFSFISS